MTDRTQESSSAQSPAASPVRIVVGAYAMATDADAPAYAVFEVTPERIAQLKALQALCEAHDLQAVRMDAKVGFPNWAGECAEDDPISMEMEGVEVKRHGGLQFTGVVRHSDYVVESRSVNITGLVEPAMLEAQAAGEAFVFLTDDDSVKEAFLRDEGLWSEDDEDDDGEEGGGAPAAPSPAG